jgi:flavodoxin I
MVTIGVFYGSSTGNSEKVAEKIVRTFGVENAISINVEDATEKDLKKFKYLVFGTSTWGIGDMQDDWEEFILVVEKVGLKNKKVALFGLGDQEIYSDSFADGMAKVYRRIKDIANIVGSWPVEGYVFDDSDALVDNKFVGLVLDEDNQSDLTDERVNGWVKILQKEFV